MEKAMNHKTAIIIAIFTTLILVLLGALPFPSTGELKVTRMNAQGDVGQPIELMLTGADDKTYKITRVATETLTLPVGWYQTRCRPLSDPGTIQARSIEISDGKEQMLRCYFPKGVSEAQTAQVPEIASPRITQQLSTSRQDELSALIGSADGGRLSKHATRSTRLKMKKHLPRPAPRSAAAKRRRSRDTVLWGSPPSTSVRRGRARLGGAQLRYSTETYSRIHENEFQLATDKPLSTLSIDVDTAAYANSRRFIEQEHRLPEKDAVRIEEFLNYFNYDYAQPEGRHPFAIHTEVSTAPWNEQHRLVHLGLQGKEVDMRSAPAANLVFLIDVSGSMNSPHKLPLLIAGFKMLSSQLRAHDRVAIVVYANQEGLLLPSTSGAERPKIFAALDGLHAGGSTAGGSGIKLAYQVAKKNFIEGGTNRVIMATDGDFNVGVSSTGALERMVEEQRDSGIFLTVLGFGHGNYKDERMEALSNRGNGNAAYIDNILEARKVLVEELGGTLVTIAKDVKIQIEFNPAKVKAYRLIGYENRLMTSRDFNDDRKDAGDLGSGHSVTALYEVIPNDSDSDTPTSTVDPLKYQVQHATPEATQSAELLTVKLRYKAPMGTESHLVSQPLIDHQIELPKTSNAFRFSSAVAEFGMLLRHSKHKGRASFAAVINRAQTAKGHDKDGYRRDFIQLVRKASTLTGIAP